MTAAQGKDDEGRAVPLYTIEPTEPPSLVLSSSLVEGSGVTEAERRFFLGGLLKLLQSYLVLPLRLSPDDLGVLVGGLVRQYVPDYAPLGFAEKRIVNEAQRQKRALGHLAVNGKKRGRPIGSREQPDRRVDRMFDGRGRDGQIPLVDQVRGYELSE